MKMTFFILFVLFLINLPPFYLFFNFITVYRIAELGVLLVFLVVIFLPRYRAKLRFSIRKSRFIFLWLVVFVAQSITAFFANDTRLFLYRYEIIFFSIIFALLFNVFLQARPSTKAFIYYFVLAFLPLVVIEILFYFFPIESKNYILPNLHATAHELILFNFDRNRNYVESFSFFIVPILIYLTKYEENLLRKLFSLSLFIIITFLALVSNFRIYIILIIFGSIATLILTNWKKRSIVQVAIITSLLFCAIFSTNFFIKTNVISRFDPKMDAPNDFLTGRTYLWSKALEIGLANPLLGVGIGNFPIYNTSESSKRLSQVSFNPNLKAGAQVFDDPHNIFLSFFAESGILGLVIIVLTLLYFLYIDTRFLKQIISTQAPGEELKGMFIVAFWSLIIYACINPINSIKFYFLFVFTRTYIENGFLKSYSVIFKKRSKL